MGTVMISSQTLRDNPAINLNAGFEMWDSVNANGVFTTNADTPLKWTLINATTPRPGNGITRLTQQTAAEYSISQKLDSDVVVALRGRYVALSIGTVGVTDVAPTLTGATLSVGPIVGTESNSAVYYVPDDATELTMSVVVPSDITYIDLTHFKLEIGKAATAYHTPSLETALLDAGGYEGTDSRIDITGQTLDMNQLSVMAGYCEVQSVRLVCRTDAGTAAITNIPEGKAFIADVDFFQDDEGNYSCLQRIVYLNGDRYSRSVDEFGVATSWTKTTGLSEVNAYATIRFWVGTVAEYNLIEPKDPNTYYMVTDGPTVDQEELLEEIGVSSVNHNHDDLYYTEDEVDALIGNIDKIVYTITPKQGDMVREVLTQLTSGGIVAAATDGAGNVLFGGGGNGGATTVDKYNTSGVKSSVTPLSISRAWAMAATDGAGNVLFAGGQQYNSGSFIQYDTVEMYSIDGIRTTITPLSVARYSGRGATDGNGNVLFGGGHGASGNATNVVDRYTISGTRTTLSALSHTGANTSAATDGNGCVLFGGGAGSGGVRSGAVDKYTANGSKTSLTPLSVGRGELAAATDGDGNVLFGGGLGNTDKVSTVDRYDVSGTRTTLTPLSIARSGLSATSDAYGNVYFGGGIGNGNGAVDVVDKYNKDGIRTTITPLSTTLVPSASTDGIGNIYFGGGGSGATRTVNRYVEGEALITLPVQPGSTYKFQEHETEQIATDDTITINAKNGNSGYVKFSGSVTI